tara:strand:+ start:47890 stop:48546 length:657 start_codon:yes stop_codon:yes gene_type:complete
MKNFTLISILLACCITFNLHAKEQPKYYRFKDESGRHVISNTLPPEYANKGYDIVSSRGNVLQHIPPQKTAAEIAIEQKQRAAEEQAKQQAADERILQASQKEKDQLLLRMFSSVKDIQRSWDEKISAIEVLESITRENVKRQKLQLEKTQKQVERLQSNGAKAPPPLLKHLHKTQSNIQDSNAFLMRKQKEKLKINAKYKALIERFENLSLDKIYSE